MASPLRNIHAFILLLIAVTAMTWALGLLDLKYDSKATISFADGFPGDTSLWERAGDWSNIDIDAERITVRRDTDNRSYAKRTFPLTQEQRDSSYQLRIRGTIETLQHGQASGNGRGAAYMIWLEDGDGEVVRYLTIQDLPGNSETYHAERIVSIPENVQAFTLVLNSRDSRNVFSLVDASVDLVSINLHYQILGMLLLGFWLLLLFLCASWLYRHGSKVLFATTLVLIIAIVIGVMLPESASSQYVAPLFDRINNLFPTVGYDLPKITYKVGHFLFFFLIAFVLMLNSESLPISRLLILFLLLLLAIASEGMQLHLFNRTTRLFDVGVDLTGIVLAWLIAAAVTLRRAA